MNTLSVLLSFPYGIAVIDRQLKVLFVNPAFYELFKMPPQRNKESANLLFSDNPIIITQLELFFRDGKGFLDHDYTIKTGDGGSSVELAINHIDFGDRDTGACLTVRSNVGRQELHSEQEKSEKISMLAMMSAGLAHEIKNPLGGIKGAAQLLSREQGDKENYCKMIVSETERINSLVDELLSLGRQKKTEAGKAEYPQGSGRNRAFTKIDARRKKYKADSRLRSQPPSAERAAGQAETAFHQPH